MTKRKSFLILLVIVVLALVAGNLCYPNLSNKGIDFVNAKLKTINLKLTIPKFPEIPFRLGLDLQGGAHLLYQADLSQIQDVDKGNALAGLRDVIERRVNLFGISEPMIQIEESSSRLIVELAGVKDVTQAIDMIGKTPYLEFREQRPQAETDAILAKQKELEGKTFEEAQAVPDWTLALQDPYFIPSQLTGRYLKRADLVFDQTTSKPQVAIEFNEEGSALFEQLTEKNIGKMIAIYIDEQMISAPVVQEKITGGKAQISGSFDLETARELARNLNAGALPVPINLISQQTVGPTLGMVSLNESLKAGFIGFIAIIIFMIIFYRLPGFLASLALAVYVALNLSLFKLIPVTLTLAGIAGFVLSMGMAVDANILFFSRMKEELRQGKGFLISLEDGFKRAWPSIRDGNFTIILVSLILFILGTSFIKGFALTLILGNLVGMFSAIFITNNLLKLFAGTKIEKWKWLLG